ncbi:unnamed protein product [Durusdinium trenchii]|uniref:subtilisin n=1 Tax=Durusdinium trenchii TaxID=1381693 RepID=A0ABP0HE49_9DINO
MPHMQHSRFPRILKPMMEKLEFAEMDQFVYPNSIPDDPHWPRLWGLDKIRMLDAWSRLTELGLDGEETVVAVIDTGVQLDHPDLMDSLWTNPGEIPDNGIDDDGNGFIDDVHGYDFAGEDGHPDDDNGHGTHCAGILAATANNGVGIAGVASRLAKVRIMALRFLSADGTGGTVSDAVRALEYALSFGVPVSSNSWGGADTSDALKVAIRRASEAGHLFVAPAGNSGRSISDGTYYPCVYRQAGVLCVAASDQSDQLTSFSNYAPEYVEITAPGVDIYSTYTGSGYRSEFGTSMATPYVAGAASLVVSAFGYSGTHVRQLLLDSAVLADNFKGKVDGGRLDVLKLIERSEPDFLFWFDSEGARTAMVSVIVAANSSKLVELQIGSDNILPGTYEAEVHTSWHDGEETIPVVYTVQGQPLLHLEQHSLEWAQVPSNATASQYLNITNSGNGTGRVQLQRLPFPFEGPENEIVVPPEGAASVSIQCAPNFTGEWLGEAAFNTNSGLDAWNSSRSTLELGTVLKVRLRCISRKPPELQMEPFSGAAEVLSGGLLRYLQPVVHAEWEPFVPGKEVEANLVLPEENNSLGCSRHNTDVSGSVLLIGRGDCYFSVKALMAQEAQALGVLLYNNQDNGALPMMAMPRDSDIPVIPMFMVTKAEGEALLARLQEEALRVKLRWQTVSAYTLPSRSDRVSIQISNTGVADLRWNARPKLSFGAHSFYETYISGVQNSSMAEFSWTEVGEDLSFFREHGQNASLQLPLPFSFSFYGQMFDKVWVTSNGFLAFEIFEGEAPPLPLPFMAGISKPNGIVAGFGWPLTCHDCRISSMEDGTCFVVQYANMSFDHPTLPMSAGSDGLSFEIRLCQDGRISMMYAKFPEPASDYRDAFIGLETIEGDALMNLRSQLPFAERPTHDLRGRQEIDPKQFMEDLFMDHSEAGFLHIEVDESLADIHQEAVAQVKPKQGIKRSRDSEEYVTLNQAKKLTMNISDGCSIRPSSAWLERWAREATCVPRLRLPEALCPRAMDDAALGERTWTDEGLVHLARNCLRVTQDKLSGMCDASPLTSMLSTAFAKRPAAIERAEERFDVFVASVVQIWCRTVGARLEGNWFVEIVQARPVQESAPFMLVGFIMGTLYVTFRLAYMPAVHLPLTSTSSVIFHSAFVLAALSYERGVTVDPGAIPENWRKAEDGRPRFELEGGRVFLHERKKKTGELRFCSKEMKFKPDRAHYCSVMRRNVLRMDHYCLWLANCVGYHNHKYFFLFLFYTLIATGTIDIGLLQALHTGTYSAGHTFMMAQGAMISSVLAALLGPFFSFHCWLMRHNMTTIEYCEKMRDNEEYRVSHYDIGILRNIQCVLGDNWMLWLLPISGPSGDGLQWGIAEQKTTGHAAGRASPPQATKANEATEKGARDDESGNVAASSTSASSSTEPWNTAGHFTAPQCMYQAGKALQDMCGNMTDYCQKIKDNQEPSIFHYGMGILQNIHRPWEGISGANCPDATSSLASFASWAGRGTAGAASPSRTGQDSPEHGASSKQDAWAALVDFAEQSRQCATTVTLAQIVRSPATVSPLQSLSTTQTAVREICCDMAAFVVNKARVAGILEPELVETVVPRRGGENGDFPPPHSSDITR